MAYIVYILYSQKSSKYYTGQTDNIYERLSRHNRGLVFSTKYGLPWELVFTKTTMSRSEAMLLEKKIKKRGTKRFLEDQNK